MSFLFLTVGPTHSGKTTFGKDLRVALGPSAKFCHVDNDVADEFVKENYNNLRTDKTILASRTPANPDLRLLIPQLITDYALRENYSVIATASHPRRIIRQSYYEIAKKNKAKIVLLRFKVSDRQCMKYIESAHRSMDILDIKPHGSTSFRDLFNKQKLIFEEFTNAEKEQCFKIFEINENNLKSILKEIAALVEKV